MKPIKGGRVMPGWITGAWGAMGSYLMKRLKGLHRGVLRGGSYLCWLPIVSSQVTWGWAERQRAAPSVRMGNCGQTLSVGKNTQKIEKATTLPMVTVSLQVGCGDDQFKPRQKGRNLWFGNL